VWDNFLSEPLAPAFPAASAVQSKLSKLQQLDLTPFSLDDAGLCLVFAHLPAITHVTVWSLKLQDKHADTQMACSWEELRIADAASFVTLARLPLRYIKRVLVGCVECTDCTGANVSAISPAAAFAAACVAAPHCHFTSHPNDSLTLICPVSQMPAMLNLLARWEGVKSLTLQPPQGETQRLTHAAVGALGVLLEGMPSCTELKMYNYAPGVSALLLPALTHSSVGVVCISYAYGAYARITETQLALWCAGSQPGRPFTVKMRCPGGMMKAHIANVHAALTEEGSAVRLIAG
jgi:hypothetical protein